MERIKVAIVLPYFGPGGAEKMVSQLCCGLPADQFDLEVFCVYGRPQSNSMELALQDKGIQIHYIGKQKGISLSAVRKLFSELDHFDPDLIHTHLYACVYAALWPVIRRKPFIHTFHTLPEIENRRPARRMLTKFLVKRKLMTPVAISESNRQLVADFYGVSDSEIPMIYNPVDIHRFSAKKKAGDEAFRFISVGRFSLEKNQQMMFRAFAHFQKKGHEAKLTLLGRGTEENNLKVLAEELNISGSIEYAGYVDNVETYLNTSDVFLLSSRYEAQPLSVLEAMAAGLPIVATDVGGVRDIVTDNGILVPAGDVDAMAQAMERLYLDASLREQMSACARKNVRAYDVSNTVAGYSELYHRYACKNQ